MSDDAALQLLAQSQDHYTIMHYLSGAGLMILVYDHLLTLDREVEHVWNAPWTLPKYLFLTLRYFVPITMIVNTFQVGGLPPAKLSVSYIPNRTPNCKTWFALSTTIGIVTIAFSNVIILFRLWAIWGRNKRLMGWTLFGFIISQLAAVACLTVVFKDILHLIVYDPTMKVCALTERRPVGILFVPGVAFEVMVFVATFWNAFDRPRSNNITLLSDLHRDGFFYFLLLFAFRSTNLILSTVAPLSLLFVAVLFIWCATTLTVSRFILNLRRTVSEQQNSRTAPSETTEVPLAMIMTERTFRDNWTEKG